MKLPLKWLKEYVDFNVTIDEFVEKMMWLGFEIAEVADEMPGITNVVVGRIEKIEQHPNADRLKVCCVNIGDNKYVQIITNATNIFENAQVPVALEGADLHGGIHIEPTVMRGVQSDGMFCSGKELGLIDADYQGADIDGIMILHDEVKEGESIQKAVGLDSVVFDIELTPNRADCQSIIGICREAAAALGQKFKEPVIKHISGSGNADEYACVTIENKELCPRYTARVVTDLKIEPSPVWMQKKLRSVGLRPISNIVDITNFIMVEYGHPMHAFDLACIADGHIVVRNAHKGELVTTLDSKERAVTEDMLLIADPTKGVGIAGVMGGENSEIKESTKATLFEAAVFKASNIRATTRKLRHTTDSAQRFMRGVEAVNAYKALERAIELVDMLGAGKVVGDVIDKCYADIDERVIHVDYAHINRILGLQLEPQYMCDLLDKINIKASVTGDTLEVHVPHYRVDIEDGIESDADIAEEIMRLHGYDKIESTLMVGDTFQGGLRDDFVDDDKMKDIMVSLGCYEMYNFNFMSPTALDNLLLSADDEKRKAVHILNPFGEEQSLMRTTLIPGIFKTLELNTKQRTEHGRFFEVGNVHFDNNDDLPEERKRLGIAFKGEDENFFTLKGAVELLLEGFGINDYRFVKGGGEYFHPGQKALVMVGEDVIGELGTVHPGVLKSFEIASTVYIAELLVDKLRAHKNANRTYKALPKYPVVPRDIAIIVDESVTCDDVCDVIGGLKLEVLIENVKLFDVYRGKGIAEGKKSMAYSFTLRDEERTLTDKDIKDAMDAVIGALSEKLGAELRQ